MGIRGLRSFITRHPRQDLFMKKLYPYLLGDCMLIIEAPNMMHKFHEYLGLDSLCGGQYEEYYQAVVEFFTTLKREYPLLRVFVLLVEVTGVCKLDVVRERKLYKLEQWSQAVETACPFSLIPGGLEDVFTEAVLACGVDTLYYDSEADDFISALALYHTAQGRNVFILSEDTDFYFTVGITGVLGMENIAWKMSSKSRPDLRESMFFCLTDFLRAISCQVWMIPILAVILGNDITPGELKQALERVKSELSSQGRGHFLSKIIFYLSSLNEETTLAKIKSSLNGEMVKLFDTTYELNKNRYICPVRNVNSNDIPVPQLAKIKSFYPGVSGHFLLKIGHLWSNRMLLTDNIFFNAEDYRQPPASLASRTIRAYYHGILLQPTQTTDRKLFPKQVTEITRRNTGKLFGCQDTPGNVIVDESLIVLYECDYSPLPNLSQVQETPRGDKINIFISIMRCRACSSVFCGREHIDYSVSILISTLYYWYHQISFLEAKTPSLATRLPPLSRQTLLRDLLISSLAVYFKERIILPAKRVASLKKATKHPHYHSVAEWCKIQKATNVLLSLLDLPVVSVRRVYNGSLLFSIITDPTYSSSVENAVCGLITEEFHNIYQDLLAPCSEHL